MDDQADKIDVRLFVRRTEYDKIKKQLDEAIKVIEFYADKESYRRFEDFGSQTCYLDDFLKKEWGIIVKDCGEMARDFLNLS